MLLAIFINNYLKKVDINKAILIAKQFNIDFTYDEMKIALPFLKQNWQMLLNENQKHYLSTILSNNFNDELSSKLESLLQKLIIILF